MNRIILSAATAIVMTMASAAAALDSAALVGTWQLVENAVDKNGKPSRFVGKQIEFTSDGKMISANMPMPFRYRINPTPAETEAAVAKNPELKGMEIMLAMMGNSQRDWLNAPIVYGVALKDDQFTMKVSGYSPARYKRK